MIFVPELRVTPCTPWLYSSYLNKAFSHFAPSIVQGDLMMKIKVENPAQYGW